MVCNAFSLFVSFDYIKYIHQNVICHRTFLYPVQEATCARNDATVERDGQRSDAYSQSLPLPALAQHLALSRRDR